MNGELTIKEGNKRKKEKKYAKCSNFNTIITWVDELVQKIKVICPNCGKNGTVVSTKDKKKNIEKSKIYFPIKKIRLPIPEKIKQHKTIWIIFLLFLTVTVLSLFFIAATGDINIEIFFVSTFIGVIVIIKFIDKFIPNPFKKKFNILMSGLLAISPLIIKNEKIYLIYS